MAGRFKREDTQRFCVDLLDVETAKLEQLAQHLGVTKGAVVRRLIEVASLPDRSKGERLCVCDGQRRFVDGLSGV